MKVGLCPGHIVLDGDPAPPKVAQPPIFVPYLLSTCYISPFYVIRFREIRLRVDLAKNIVAAGTLIWKRFSVVLAKGRSLRDSQLLI